MPTFSSKAIFTPGRANTPAAQYTPQATPQPCCCPACTGLDCLDRTRFFAGQLLTETDLNNDQAYYLAKNRLHNRYLQGWGVVCGMQVVCSACDGWVTVKTGYAIDPCGNDIIVCAEQSFNVIKAIQACCTPAKPADCSPLRSAPPPNCQDAEQKWCITIQYDEQPARNVTPLRQRSSQTGACGCGGSGNGGCGCGGKTTTSSSGASSSSPTCCCSTATKASTTGSSNPSCEPTRILEGFRLGVCPAPITSSQTGGGNIQGGPAGLQASPCVQGVAKLILQKPDLSGLSDAATYSAACNYLSAIRQFLAGAALTHCQDVAILNQIQIPRPGNIDGYNAAVQTIVDQAAQSLAQIALDCFCLSLLPTCPPDPCTNCLVLACVTVQNGQIIDICHFDGGRRQVVTFPALQYWLSLFGFDKFFGVLLGYLEQACCGELELGRLFLPALAQADNLSTAGFTNPAIMNRMMSTALSQKLGAPIVNAVAPDARTLDLRPLVGLGVEEVSRLINSNQIQANIVQVGPGWTDTSSTLGQLFAPAAFSASQPLTVYTSGKLVVGFEATSPTDTLKQQVAVLQQEVAALQSQLGSSSGRTDTAKHPKKG